MLTANPYRNDDKGRLRKTKRPIKHHLVKERRRTMLVGVNDCSNVDLKHERHGPSPIMRAVRH